MTLVEAFPEVESLVYPLGGRVLLQMKWVTEKTESGIILASDTANEEKWNTQVAKVIYLGPLAYRNRETGKPWVEDIWVKPGDFVRVPRWGGDRFSSPAKHDPSIKIPLVIFNDHEIISKIIGDPLKVEAYIL